MGFTSLEPWRLAVDKGCGARLFELETGLEGLHIQTDDELSWVVFPEGGGSLDELWDATYATVDVEFDDGTWLSAGAVTDQYAGGITARAQGSAKRLWVNQWNGRRVRLSMLSGRRVRRVFAVVEASPRCDLTVLLDDVRIAAPPASPTAPLGFVDTRRGSHSSDRFSRGNTAPLVGLPHGGVFGLPMTDASRGNWPYSYHQHNRESDNRPTIQAFATSHLPSPWMGDRGVFQVMPSPDPVPDTSRAGRALSFDHAAEQASAHLYRVELDGGVTAEMAAGEFALGLRFGFPADTASIILDHHGSVGDYIVRTEGEDTVVEAVLDDRPGTPPHAIHLRVRGVTEQHLTYAGGRLGGYLTVATGPDGWVDVRLGISTIDVAQAAQNLTAAGNFDVMATRAREMWEQRLATLDPDVASLDQAVSLYSGLYRTFLYPNRYAETAGRVRPAFRSPYDLRTIGTGALSTTHGFWDTYRTAWPLLALLTPDAAGELAQGFVNHSDHGGWTPRWSAPGAQDCMTGTTLDTVLADLVARGVPGLDVDASYATALKNATVPPGDPRVGRKGLRPGIFRGYIDTETPEGLSWTLDNAINDWATATLARATSGGLRQEDREAEWEYFCRRSLSYRFVFDTARSFFIGRTPGGDWRADEGFDPEEWGHDYTETNAWGTAFTVPHDGSGLADLHGGEQALGAALDTFFHRPETGDPSKSGSYGFAIHEMTEARDVRMGMLGMSNQPAHHIPFMYMFAGRHDDAHRIVRECLDRLFVGSDLGQGYPGDEDNGEMSAWYVFGTLGLYPLVPGSGTYVLVPPSLPRTVIRPVGGRPITIEVVNFDPSAHFIRVVRVNDEPWDDVSISHDLLVAGAHIEFELSTTPCGWARDSRPVSASQLHGFRDTLVDAAGPRGTTLSDLGGAGRLFDDLGLTTVLVRAQDMIAHRFPAPVALGLYTVTVDSPATVSWRIDYVSASGAVAASEGRDAEVFTWPGQTRVFRVDRGSSVTAAEVRFVALGEYDLRQLEFFPVDTGAPPVASSRQGSPHPERNTEGCHAR